VEVSASIGRAPEVHLAAIIGTSMLSGEMTAITVAMCCLGSKGCQYTLLANSTGLSPTHG
jgi:hypothetical protein